MSGNEMQRAKESAAEIMRQKQLAGTPPPGLQVSLPPFPLPLTGARETAEAKKAEAAGKK